VFRSLFQAFWSRYETAPDPFFSLRFGFFGPLSVTTNPGAYWALWRHSTGGMMTTESGNTVCVTEIFSILYASMYRLVCELVVL